MANQATAVRGLGEIALRVSDLYRMKDFYQRVIRLELIGTFPNAAFFKLADGYEGHTQVLALFDRSQSPGYQGLSTERSTIDHVAFEVSMADLEGERKRLEHLGLEVTTAEHTWVHWRSLYVKDPEGNMVELVCYDPSV